MASRIADGRERPAGISSHGYSPTRTNHDAIRRWLLVIATGAGLGVYTIVASRAPSYYGPLMILVGLLPFVAMIVGQMRKLLLAIILLDIPLQLGVHPGYQNQFASIGAISGLDLSVTTLSLIILYALWMAQLLTRKTVGPRSILMVGLPAILYLGFVTLSILAARNLTLSFDEIFLLAQMVLLYIYIVGTVQTREEVLFMVTMLIVGLALEGLLIVALAFGGHIPGLAGLASRFRVDTDPASSGLARVGGTVGSPNNAAGYLTMLLTTAFAVMLTQLGRWHKRLALLAFGAGGVALILTFSRGGWLGLIVALTLLCLLAWARGWITLTWPIALAAIAVLLAIPFRDDIAARLLASDNGAAYVRIPLMALAFRIIAANPLLGVGANNYAVVFPSFMSPDIGLNWSYIVHNRYLLVWAETGTGGLLAFVGFLLVTLRRGWNSFLQADRVLSPLALGMVLGMVALMIHMFVEDFHDRPVMQELFVVAALLAVMSRLLNEKHAGVEDGA